MTDTARVDTARKGFAELTGALDDATLVSAEGQASPNLLAARRSCDRLIALLEACLARAKQLRKRLE